MTPTQTSAKTRVDSAAASTESPSANALQIDTIREELFRGLYQAELTGKGLDPWTVFIKLIKKYNGSALHELFSSAEELLPGLSAYHAASWSNVEGLTFTKPPPSSRLNQLAYFSIIGLDLKVTPEGDLALIEVNGINSGMKGFARTRTTVPDPNGALQRADRALRLHLTTTMGTAAPRHSSVRM